MAPKRGLGKGLGSLIPDNYQKKSQAAENVEKNSDVSTDISTKTSRIVDKPVENQDNRLDNAQFVKITSVERNKNQPREQFDEESIKELADSIKQYGVLQPLLVKPSGKRYMIIAGERRWRAAKMAGIKEIPVIIKDYTDQEIMEISLIENIQREDLNVIEEAMAYQRLLDEFGYRQGDLAEKISRSRTAITNRLRLLKLSKDVQEMVKDGRISEGHARTLLPLTNPTEQLETAKLIVENRMSVRETERLVKKLLNPPAPKDPAWQTEDQFVYDQLEEDLRSAIGTKVAIKRQEKDKGKIVIDYYSAEELERIMDLLKKRN